MAGRPGADVHAGVLGLEVLGRALAAEVVDGVRRELVAQELDVAPALGALGHGEAERHRVPAVAFDVAVVAGGVLERVALLEAEAEAPRVVVGRVDGLLVLPDVEVGPVGHVRVPEDVRGRPREDARARPRAPDAVDGAEVGHQALAEDVRRQAVLLPEEVGRVDGLVALVHADNADGLPAWAGNGRDMSNFVKPPISIAFRSIWLTFGRAIISLGESKAWMHASRELLREHPRRSDVESPFSCPASRRRRRA